MSQEIIQNLPAILQSSDFAIRTRAINLFYSIFMQKPEIVLNEFERFSNFFHEVLKNSSEDSITYFTLNNILFTAILSLKDKIGKIQMSRKAIFCILNYISDYLANPMIGGRITVFVSDRLFEITDHNVIITCIYYLCSFQMQPEYFPPLIQIMSITNDKTILSICNQFKNDVIKQIIQNPKDTVESTFKCVSSSVPEISTLMAAILNRASAESKVVAKMLVQYAIQIQGLVNFATSNDLKGIYQHIMEAMTTEKQKPPPDPAPFEYMAKVMFAKSIFDSVNASNTKKFLSEIRTSTSASVLLGNSNSLAIHLDKISDVPVETNKMPASPAQQPQQQSVSVPSSPALKYMKADVSVKGNAKVLEFFPSNKCIVWKDFKKGVEGMVFVDSTLKAEKDKLALCLITKDKIKFKFNDQNTIDEWMNTIKSCQ